MTAFVVNDALSLKGRGRDMMAVLVVNGAHPVWNDVKTDLSYDLISVGKAMMADVLFKLCSQP